MTPNEPLVRFRGVRKSFGGAPVIRDLDLAVGRGELVTLLGPSGAGKSTILMLLAGFERPDAGTIEIEGNSVIEQLPHQRRLGAVFQDFALFPHLSVAENVAFPLRVRGIAREERRARVARALDMVRMTGLEARSTETLSGGQGQRVALARAIVSEPPLLLLDEPFGALDRGLRAEMQTEIRELQRRLGVTMLFVTHDQDEAMTLADRIAIFADGIVQQADTPRALYERPANPYVASFLGENNKLPGILGDIDDEGFAVVTLACGIETEAMAADGMQSGDACIVSVRPELVAVAAASADDLGPQAIAARIVETRYLGDHVRIRATIGLTGKEPAELLVKRPAQAAVTLAAGENVAVAWQPHMARAFRPRTPP